LPDNIKDKIQKALGKAASKVLLTHCRREIFQAAWLILIQDPEFLEAYINGIVVECIDGIRRRLFPRFFVYSADYPEKYAFLCVVCLSSHVFRVKIATIRDFGMYPCPRCLVPKDKIPEIGRDEDRCTRTELGRTDTVERQGRVDQARKNLYDSGYALAGDYVDGMLKDGSLVPTRVRVP
jgi:hypothetical protein